VVQVHVGPTQPQRLPPASAVPDHGERILSDASWPALAAGLADAEASGHQPHQLLKEAAAQRELTTARQPARVLITRIQRIGCNPVPNRRAEAARRRSTTRTWPAGSVTPAPQQAGPAATPGRKNRPRR
jgi:hypothetical protein